MATGYYCEGLDLPPRYDLDSSDPNWSCQLYHRLHPKDPREVSRMIERRDFGMGFPEGHYQRKSAEMIQAHWVTMPALMTVGECYHGGEDYRHRLQQVYDGWA